MMLITEFLAARVEECKLPGMGFARIHSLTGEAVALILREHNTPAVLYPSEPRWAPEDQRCSGCGFNNAEESMCENVNDCPVLRALAWVWQDHPGWNPAWKPEGV